MKSGANFFLIWYLALVCTFFFASLFLVYISFTHYPLLLSKQQYQLYQALPDSFDAQKQEIKIGKVDGRHILITQFFEEHKSPLKDYAADFVKVADKYNLDYRLLPAISMQESNGGKRLPKDSYNPFGYGIYGEKVTRFSSFSEAIERVGRGLKEDYIQQGLETPQQIMAKYTPPSLKKGGVWALGVSAFMEQLR